MSTPKRVTRPIRENPLATTLTITGAITAAVAALAQKYAPGMDIDSLALIAAIVAGFANAVIGWLAQRFTLPAAAVDLVLTPEQRAAMFPLLRATESGSERPAQPFPGPLPHRSAEPSADLWMDSMRAPAGEPQDTLPPTSYPVEAGQPAVPYGYSVDYGSTSGGTATINSPTAGEVTGSGNQPPAT